MSDHVPLAQKVEGELDALDGLRRRKPLLFWILLVFLTVFAALYAYDKFWGIPALKGEIGSLRSQIAEKNGELHRLELENLSLRQVNQEFAKNTHTNLDATLQSLQIELSKFRLAFPMSTFDGTVALGNSSKATPITQLMAEVQTLVNSKQYDAAEERLRAVEKLWPDFPGASFFRFQILAAKGDGYKNEAEAMAERAISTMTDATDYLKPLYEFAINAKLARGQKAAAEELSLRLIRSYPDETNFVAQFVRLFGYMPIIAGRKP